ncbi:MAG TPA: DUF4837 family protein [Flavobacteriaceae bacterium]|nr:DUF4837 family protein [Flavobacteriaceae bacterium]MCB9211932.1 DUF4837 family protein [Alteromonas sp.]HPF09974.1 DUF4837 family protein [Flavobacteriaceae bacterium]HQU20071.1 DUF4837 family protein [Flavobacteriaceae bacterium]HQU63943.1 DUF4837 family protein [Flavobacteriaceae bacterium]
MKIFIYPLLFCSVLFFSCNSSTEKRNTVYLPESVGAINGLQIVISNDLWNNQVGERIREYFAAPTDGLPRQEPLFSINQIQPENYTDFARTYRTFLHITLADVDSVKIKKNSFAKPQIGAFITGTNEEKLLELLDSAHQSIIQTFKAYEIKERQRRTNISLLKVDSLTERFGISMKIPSAYRVASACNDFYWIRKDLKSSGSTNILIYEVPLSVIGRDTTIIGDIVRMRDTIGSGYLPVEDDALFVTEEAYAPYLFTTEIDHKFAYETKGTWEVKGAYMAGPFVNYAIRDEAHQRYLIIEGFTYAPSMEQRDLQFELESIIKSTKFEGG